ncbi:MAG: HD domain-containing protein [Actinomycetia bacterium]|nr:HD domain-containing protein [Actinomycetes bacterium]
MEPHGHAQPTSAAMLAEPERLAGLMHAHDRYTAEHALRVRTLGMAMGQFFELSKAELLVLNHAAHLHDLGKLAVPDEIVRKPGPLTQAEWRLMRRHPVEGARAVVQLGFCARTGAAVRHHHEHFDGSGYPDGLSGDEIPLAARLIHVADALDAMITDRVYCSGRPLPEALTEVRHGAGTQFCPRCVSALEHVLE